MSRHSRNLTKCSKVWKIPVWPPSAKRNIAAWPRLKSFGSKDSVHPQFSSTVRPHCRAQQGTSKSLTPTTCIEAVAHLRASGCCTASGECTLIPMGKTTPLKSARHLGPHIEHLDSKLISPFESLWYGSSHVLPHKCLCKANNPRYHRLITANLCCALCHQRPQQASTSYIQETVNASKLNTPGRPFISDRGAGHTCGQVWDFGGARTLMYLHPPKWHAFVDQPHKTWGTSCTKNSLGRGRGRY